MAAEWQLVALTVQDVVKPLMLFIRLLPLLGHCSKFSLVSEMRRMRK